MDQVWLEKLIDEFNALPGSNQFFVKTWMNQDSPLLRHKFLKQKFPYLNALFTGSDQDYKSVISILRDGIQQEKLIRGLFQKLLLLTQNS